MCISRRSLLSGALGIATAGGLAGCVDLAVAAARHESGVHTDLRIGYLPITDATPVLIAHGHGFFGNPALSEGSPTMFRSWSSLAEAFLSRQVDVVHLLMPMAVQIKYALNGRVRVIGWNHTNGSALTVNKSITDIEQLAGSQVAIPFWWSIHNIVLQKMLRARGMIPVIRSAPSKSKREVGLIVMSPPDMLPALATGAIDGYTVADPFNAIAEVKGVGKIHRFLGDAWRDHACCVLMVHEDVIARRPSAVQELSDSVVNAQILTNKDRTAAGTLLHDRRYLPQPTTAIQKALTYPAGKYPTVHPSWASERIGYTPFPYPSYTKTLVQEMESTVVDGDRSFLTRIDVDRVHSDLVDDRFVRESIRKYGGPTRLGLAANLNRVEEMDYS